MEYYDTELYLLKAELCKTFADPKRLMIIEELRNGEKSVGELAERLSVPHAVASRHLAILRERGAVRARRDGTSVFYSLSDPRIGEACQLVHQALLGLMERNRELAEKVIRS
ncbi:MAG TPA: helix-turn-helix transcriptional regulator [Dehalococcoidia bacterium]|nr:helix-turn-helix transcriptional regulator [Dehalococcoidia bacterium]